MCVDPYKTSFCEGCKERQKKIDLLKAALVMLKDCDWVITPHDRMDAVREIAKEALNQTEKIK